MNVAGLAAWHVESVTAAVLPRAIAKDNATAGSPEVADLVVYDTGRVTSGIWECTPGSFPSAKDGASEYMTVLAGDATVHDEDGTAHVLRPGTALFLADGWRGSWEIRETIRKTYTLVKS